MSSIDVYDPVDDEWYNSVTNIPTPRYHAQILSFKQKIYVIGGIVNSGFFPSGTNLVEVYDPFENDWKTLEPMPSPLIGGVIGTSGDSIYLLAGTTTTDMTTGTILNTIYRFDPELGSNGRWTSYLSSTNIFPRVDMSYCTLNGSIYFTGGRFYQNGASQTTSDVYVPSANSTTSKIEASISLARHGTASACYNPKPADGFPDDPAIFMVAGGSVAMDINQPATTNLPTNVFEYSIIGNQLNNFSLGSNLPIPLYYGAMEISYQKRKTYFFGGASDINLPTDHVYSINLSNPSGNPWELLEKRMPRPRYAHKAVILNR